MGGAPSARWLCSRGGTFPARCPVGAGPCCPTSRVYTHTCSCPLPAAIWTRGRDSVGLPWCRRGFESFLRSPAFSSRSPHDPVRIHHHLDLNLSVCSQQCAFAVDFLRPGALTVVCSGASVFVVSSVCACVCLITLISRFCYSLCFPCLSEEPFPTLKSCHFPPFFPKF